LKNERKDDLQLGITLRGFLGPERHEVSLLPLINNSLVAKPYIYLVDVPEWNKRFDDLPHTAEAGSIAWAVIDGDWKQGTYICPASDEDEDGDDIRRLGWQRVMIDGEEVEVESRWCLLRRAYDEGIVRFKERNTFVVNWAKHFSDQGKPTLVVATRTAHVYILQTMMEAAGLQPKVLTGMSTSKERDETFEWLVNTTGSILISPIVKEGVSLPELRAGIVADPVASPDLARQIIGRFIRTKKTGSNEAEVVMFIDRQYKSARYNSMALIKQLEKIRGYSFYYPCQGPDKIGPLFEAVSMF
jgi:superfamily II DNA or RNA helicase